MSRMTLQASANQHCSLIVEWGMGSVVYPTEADYQNVEDSYFLKYSVLARAIMIE